MTTRTTDYVLYLQTVSFFSHFIFVDHNDHRFCFVSTKSFIYLSIYFGGPQGPRILYSIFKQFHFSFNLFRGKTRTTDYILYLQTFSFSLNLFFKNTRTTNSVFYLQTVTFFSQFIFDDHKDHRFYFMSANSFILSPL